MSEKTMRVQDYPLATRCPEHILTPTGKPLTDITLEKDVYKRQVHRGGVEPRPPVL